MAIPATSGSNSTAANSGESSTNGIGTTGPIATSTVDVKSSIHRFKCVCFDNQPSYFEIISCYDLSDTEKEAAWFQQAELRSIQAAAMDPESQQLSEGEDPGSLRGLERYSTAGSTRLEIHRIQVVAAVLREQQRQRTSFRLGFRKADELLAEASAKLSQECQDLAYMQGYNDEVEAYAGSCAVQTDVVDIPKPSFFGGLRKQVRALSDLAFLESQSRGKR
ncbi:expressed unknown protein [Seminavis robusta]|uniref:Uncharacterized protein n=1 Tax=Seminavis robusta TaxID=568900 RepID=A0A9N8HW94_9STRA|nr:expressed unknown protein [Seminavis robusta]|eukprot:Sro2119_g315350.1 n/a (221) ;mRNA; f:7312-7974